MIIKRQLSRSNTSGGGLKESYSRWRVTGNIAPASGCCPQRRQSSKTAAVIRRKRHPEPPTFVERQYGRFRSCQKVVSFKGGTVGPVSIRQQINIVRTDPLC